MAIKCDFDLNGILVKDGYVKVSKLLLINHGDIKVWNCVMSYQQNENAEVLKVGNAFGFNYVEGQDPIKQAYLACGVSGTEV